MNQRELLLSMRPWLRAEAAVMLGWERSRHIEDLAQEGWIAVWKVYGDYPAGRVEELRLPWCKAVARNRMRNWVRDELLAVRRGDDNAVPASDVLADLAEASDGVVAAYEVDHSYHEGKVAQALAALPPRQRAYVTARFFQGIPTTELHREFSPRTWAGAKLNLARSLEELLSV